MKLPRDKKPIKRFNFLVSVGSFSAFNRLTTREKQIVEMRSKGMQLKAIAEALGITRIRVSQIQARALSRFREEKIKMPPLSFNRLINEIQEYEISKEELATISPPNTRRLIELCSQGKSIDEITSIFVNILDTDPVWYIPDARRKLKAATRKRRNAIPPSCFLDDSDPEED